MNTNKTPAKLPLTKEQLDVIAASLVEVEPRYKDLRIASVAEALEGTLDGPGDYGGNGWIDQIRDNTFDPAKRLQQQRRTGILQ